MGRGYIINYPSVNIKISVLNRGVPSVSDTLLLSLSPYTVIILFISTVYGDDPIPVNNTIGEVSVVVE